jgi:hypothetical protein
MHLIVTKIKSKRQDCFYQIQRLAQVSKYSLDNSFRTKKGKAKWNFLNLTFWTTGGISSGVVCTICMYTKNRSNLIAKTKADVSSFFCWTWRVESIQDLNLILGTQWKVQYLKPVILYSYLLNTVVFRWKVNERKTIHFFVIIQRYFDV